MPHHMHLHSHPFNLIKSGKQIIETRINDEKRRLLSIGDEIEFENRENPEEKLRVKIIDLIIKPTFSELYDTDTPEVFGGKDEEELMQIYKYYSPEEEKQHGVVGIRVKRI